MEQLGRRRFLALGSAAGAVALAGCAVGSGNTEPEPVVVTNNPNEMLDGTLADARGREVEVSPIVHNPGSSSDIEVTMTAYNDDRDELASTSEVFAFDNREQKRVTIVFAIPTNAARIAGEARRV